MVDLLERMDILLEQECRSYRTEDYLSAGFQQRLNSDYPDETLSSSYSACSSSTSSSGINEVWREKICEWKYQVVDHFDFSREVASISIHYLDRYLATRPVNKKVFQLAAMTALYLAIKLYEPGTVSMKSMIELSRGYFMVEQMAEMEVSILRALAWKVHPPTAYCFSKHILFLLPYTRVTMDQRYDILEMSRFLTELSVIDYFFVLHRPSVVALAALLNAMELIPAVSETAENDLKHELKCVSGLDPYRLEVEQCRDRLRLLYSQGGYECPETVDAGHTRTETVSPVCVSHGVYPHDPAQQSSSECEAEDSKQHFNFSEGSMNEAQFHFEGSAHRRVR